jgi:hypothetical protein
MDKVKEKVDDPLGIKKKIKSIIFFAIGAIILIGIILGVKFIF